MSPSATQPVLLSTRIEDPTAIPYFLWDEPISVAELRERLVTSSDAERLRLLGKILREARDPDVWHFTTPEEVADLWERVSIHLGRRRSFWEFLLGRWRELGLLAR